MPQVTANDAAIYAANDLITALTKPQPPNSFLSLGNDQLAALQQLANIFQRAVNKTRTSAPGVPDLTPPQRPRTRSQTKSLANAALTIPNHNHPYQSHPKPPEPTKQEEDSHQDPTSDTPNFTKPQIVPVIQNLRPKYPTKHEGMLEDPFPLIQSTNAVTDPDTGQQLEYRQLINHPNAHLRKTWQLSSANKFGRLAQGVGDRITGTETIRFIHHHEMLPTRRPTYARFVCEI